MNFKALHEPLKLKWIEFQKPKFEEIKTIKELIDVDKNKYLNFYKIHDENIVHCYIYHEGLNLEFLNMYSIDDDKFNQIQKEYFIYVGLKNNNELN